MSVLRHRISPDKLAAISASLDEKARISVGELARIFGEPGDERERRDLEADHEEALYRQYLAHVGAELVEVPPEEWAQIEAGIAKGERVEREIAAEREQEARELAAEERREIAEADWLWPAYQAALGPTGGYE